MTQREKIEIAVKALDSKKGEDIRVIGIRDLTIIADYFIIAAGNSTTQVKALADEVDFKLSQQGVSPLHSEGYSSSEWVVLDYGDIIVHVFYKATREFYSLERLWADGEQVDISDILE